MERKQATSIDEFVGHLNEVAKIERLRENRKDPRKEVLEEADRDIANYAFNRYEAYATKKLEPFNSWENKVNPDDLTNEEKDFTLNFSARVEQEGAANLLYEKANEISSKMSNKSLEYLVSASDSEGKQIIKQYIDSDKDKTMYTIYEQVVRINEVLDRFKNGERSEYIKQFYDNAVIEGLAADTEKALRKAGYSIDIQNLGMSFAVSAYGKGRIDKSKTDKYAESGLKKLAEDAKNAYQNYRMKKNDGKDIYLVVREALAKGAKDKSPENFSKVFSATYQATKKAA